MTTPYRNRNRQVLEEASDWFVEFRVGEIGKAKRREFMQWLQRSPEHIRAYIEISGAYARLPTVATVDESEVERLIQKTKCRTTLAPLNGVRELPVVPSMTSGRSPVRRHPMLLAASLAVLCVSMLIVGWHIMTTPPLYATTTAERRSITLADGSNVELNARTKVRISYTAHERHVDLLEGQVLFRVAKDPQRPFIVSSAGAQVRAVGTRFDVHVLKSGTTVTVLEGRVAVQASSSTGDAERREAMGSATPPHDTTVPVELVAGEQVTITPSAVAKTTRTNVAAAIAWTQGLVEFDETPLTDVAEEFNRHYRVPLVIESASLADFRVSGIYSFEDPSSLIRFLQSQPDLIVTQSATEISVRQK